MYKISKIYQYTGNKLIELWEQWRNPIIGHDKQNDGKGYY